jgi:hypothetical protein
MKSKASNHFAEAGASIGAQLSSNNAPRAVLVSLDGAGHLVAQAVEHGQSILNIETELQNHLNSRPWDDQFLADLRDYCAGRLAARAEAKKSGGVSMPRAGGWNITHVNTIKVEVQ